MMRERRSVGQTAAELALLLPVLVLIALSGLDLGRAFSAWVTLTHAVREGARYGCLYPARTSDITLRVQEEATAGGLAATKLHVPPPAPGTPGGESITVAASYDLELVSTFPFGNTTVPIRASARMALLPGGSSASPSISACATTVAAPGR